MQSTRDDEAMSFDLTEDDLRSYARFLGGLFGTPTTTRRPDGCYEHRWKRESDTTIQESIAPPSGHVHEDGSIEAAHRVRKEHGDD